MSDEIVNMMVECMDIQTQVISSPIDPRKAMYVLRKELKNV